MTKYLLKRVLQAIGVVFCISLITFFVLNIVPGNPVEIMLGEFADQATIARVTHEMGLDQPIYIQYFSWLGNMLQGNFGTSYFQNKPVIDILTSSFLVTAKLAGIASVLLPDLYCTGLQVLPNLPLNSCYSPYPLFYKI